MPSWIYFQSSSCNLICMYVCACMHVCVCLFVHTYCMWMCACTHMCVLNRQTCSTVFFCIQKAYALSSVNHAITNHVFVGQFSSTLHQWTVHLDSQKERLSGLNNKAYPVQSKSMHTEWEKRKTTTKTSKIKGGNMQGEITYIIHWTYF